MSNSGEQLDQNGDEDGEEIEPRIEGLEILEPLGRGGTSSVWKARQVSLQRLVVVKVLAAGDIAFVTQTVDVQYSFVRATKTVTFLPGFEPNTGDTVRIERFTTRDRRESRNICTTPSQGRRRRRDQFGRRLTVFIAASIP